MKVLLVYGNMHKLNLLRILQYLTRTEATAAAAAAAAAHEAFLLIKKRNPLVFDMCVRALPDFNDSNTIQWYLLSVVLFFLKPNKN